MKLRACPHPSAIERPARSCVHLARYRARGAYVHTYMVALIEHFVYVSAFAGCAMCDGHIDDSGLSRTRCYNRSMLFSVLCDTLRCRKPIAMSSEKAKYYVADPLLLVRAFALNCYYRCCTQTPAACAPVHDSMALLLSFRYSVIGVLFFSWLSGILIVALLGRATRTYIHKGVWVDTRTRRREFRFHFSRYLDRVST